MRARTFAGSVSRISGNFQMADSRKRPMGEVRPNRSAFYEQI